MAQSAKIFPKRMLTPQATIEQHKRRAFTDDRARQSGPSSWSRQPPRIEDDDCKPVSAPTRHRTQRDIACARYQRHGNTCNQRRRPPPHPHSGDYRLQDTTRQYRSPTSAGSQAIPEGNYGTSQLVRFSPRLDDRICGVSVLQYPPLSVTTHRRIQGRSIVRLFTLPRRYGGGLRGSARKRGPRATA